jgi:hypothetical protein
LGFLAREKENADAEMGAARFPSPGAAGMSALQE